MVKIMDEEINFVEPNGTWELIIFLEGRKPLE